MSYAIGGLFNAVAAIIVVFGLCLVFHELGHFLFARFFKMHVEEFALGFGRALLSYKRGETVYRLNIFPYGAYVRITGMEPGVGDVERGFHSRPRWQGALVLIGGSLANLILAIGLFTMVTYWTGLPDYSDNGIYVSKAVPGGPAAAASIQPGDQIIAIDNATRSLEISMVTTGSVADQAGIRIGEIIERVGDQEVYVPADLLTAMQTEQSDNVPVTLIDYSVNELADQQRVINLKPPASLYKASISEATEALEKALGVTFGPLSQTALVGYIGSRPAKKVRLTLMREGRRIDQTMLTNTTHKRVGLRDSEGKLYSRIRPVGQIGVVMRGATRPVHLDEALAAGTIRSLGSALIVVESIRLMLRREVEAELAGPVAIMAISVEKARVGWDAVLGWGGMVSAMLAVANLLPIPPFDGFRLVLLGCEAIIRRRVYPKLEWALSIAGFVVVMALFVMLTSKDLANLVRYGTP